eukprot:CAMPEP_0113435996 /NCGR_PEP_ID=MMETSP0013_2-20120614/36592_1 /TAXON_ID=2843 ORGANISM="Skeletonema costatum, Strain 1716" /NCGR_SAMPLE_ID=MMETSP0013_2 /ASSEMBLY_ACC=CAM_ASM_000158 /LENGTH=61 /DNA_ID=CAMNT_0000326445 /DNA_START=54 /DNA_END=236 /DNA_ORIENTATION=+ /assembly_acc=CAM_ASM_000158
MMNNKQTLLAILALSAAHGSSAFVATPSRTISRSPLFSTVGESSTDAVAADAAVTDSVDQS